MFQADIFKELAASSDLILRRDRSFDKILSFFIPLALYRYILGVVNSKWGECGQVC
jgi:hypothetical protein